MPVPLLPSVCQRADDIRQARVGLLVVVSESKSTTHSNVEALKRRGGCTALHLQGKKEGTNKLVLLDDGNEAYK